MATIEGIKSIQNLPRGIINNNGMNKLKKCATWADGNELPPSTKKSLTSLFSMNSKGLLRRNTFFNVPATSRLTKCVELIKKKYPEMPLVRGKKYKTTPASKITPPNKYLET